MRSMLALGISLAVVASAAPAQEARPSKKEGAEAAKLVGTYKLVSGKHGGKDLPKNHLDGRVNITADTISTYDADHKEVYVLRYTVEPAEDGSRISMTVTRSSRPDAVGMKANGRIKVDGDRVSLIYDYEKAEAPKDFKPDDESQNLFVLERIQDKK